MWHLITLLALTIAEECDMDSLQSPIDIVEPFTYKETGISFYLGAQKGAILYHDGYSLRIDGDFGGFKWENSYFWATEILFKSPSEHTLEGTRLDMEMQINFKDQHDFQAVVVALFQNSTQDSQFLNDVGFGNPNLRNAEEGWLFRIRKDVDVNSFLGYPMTYLYYEGSTTLEPCISNVTWFILTNTYRISDNQMYNFPINLLGNYRETQSLNGRSIYTNFDESDIDEAEDLFGEEDSDDLIYTLSTGESYKLLNDDFIIEADVYEDEFPEVDSVYT